LGAELHLRTSTHAARERLDRVLLLAFELLHHTIGERASHRKVTVALPSERRARHRVRIAACPEEVGGFGVRTCRELRVGAQATDAGHESWQLRFELVE